jgi:hypothetical protein
MSTQLVVHLQLDLSRHNNMLPMDGCAGGLFARPACYNNNTSDVLRSNTTTTTNPNLRIF